MMAFTLFPIKTFAAVGTPLVTDGETHVYVNNGVTVVTESLDVYVTPDDDTTYYYFFTGYSITVDVFYSGAAANPVGSYFSESDLVTGSFVKTLGLVPDAIFGTKLDAVDEWKINVPLPAPGKPYELKIAAYKNGEVSEVYTHEFTVDKYIFKAELEDGKIVSKLKNNTDAAFNGTFLIAVYDSSGKLVFADTHSFTSPLGGGEAVFEFPTDVLDAYPGDGYLFKAFCWNASYIPVADAIVFEGAN
jgi:hypothetical protein